MRASRGARSAAMTVAGAALLLLAVTGPAAAQDKAPGSCDGVLADCADRSARSWDERLNESYRALMARLTPARRDALRDAQRRWIAFRDAECRFHATGEGAIGRLNASGCVLRMTEERTRELMRLGGGTPGAS